MTSHEIRKAFLDFFASKGHQIVPSAPLIVKNDPTLMFTNAGMNQFKDYFLGNSSPKYKRVADTQKCLRVSGKHNDLEEVGVDTYHHTMFEMLGNWSFGDYFKEAAIAWAWELLTGVYKLSADRLYVTVFEGDDSEKLDFDTEAQNCWEKWIDKNRIINGNKKDNFWEMGETGPCGPCSEIHIDLRSDEERAKIDGKSLVNTGHSLVVEIWNLVFMQYNRMSDGKLVPLPDKHVDTGMGFERLCMAIQQKKSNYDTDVFTPLINYISTNSGIVYGSNEKTDIAMRVISDHIRAISFAIADGQLPSNNKSGYVIRRILRRAVRYSFAFLNMSSPFIYKLVPVLANQLKDVFPELKSQEEFVARVIREEETSFLRTLEAGLKKLDELAPFSLGRRVGDEGGEKGVLNGEFAFELYDTFGFPIDLTQLIAREKNLSVDMEAFNAALIQQKERSRNANVVESGDWTIVREGEETKFVGYELLESEAEILRFRKTSTKGKNQFQLVLNVTPFYAESGGQIGDTGFLESANERIEIIDTQKENNLILHICERLPENLSAKFHASVNETKRRLTENNHSATHLMHAALRAVLGKHVAQKGSLVNEELTRFDFSHFTKVSDEEMEKIEKLVNEKIREDIVLNEKRNVPLEEARNQGAMALFGEKYGEFVRMITFDKNYSVELCGGTHVSSTGKIGLFKIISEGAVAAGVRRIEAITAKGTEQYVKDLEIKLQNINEILKNPADTIKAINSIIAERDLLKEQFDSFMREKANIIKSELLKKMIQIKGINFIGEIIEIPSAELIKDISFELKREVGNLYLVLGAKIEGKAHLSVMLSDELVNLNSMNATKIIKELSKDIQGGGGGQPFYATAGGKNPDGLISNIMNKAKSFVINIDEK